ncbi:MAG: ATP-binding protein [Spirochaetia bacterium]|nr:ATP-binding protein [Spirochaetia bacterium]
MERLFEHYRNKLAFTKTAFVRSLEQNIDWKSSLIGIRGPRGVGKSNLMLQHIKKAFKEDYSRALYASLDDLYFADNSLSHLAEQFTRRGGTHLFLDEVHKYPKWDQAVKSLHDNFPGLSIVYAGSSLLENQAHTYDMQGLSFREYLAFNTNREYPIFSLEDILTRTEEISAELASEIKPFKYFDNYLRMGYYPFFILGEKNYLSRMNETINMILDIELPILRNMETSSIPKIRKLLAVISKASPCVPNVASLASHIGVARQTLLSYLKHLEEGNLIVLLYKGARGTGSLVKPDRLYLENSNLMHDLMDHEAAPSDSLETFVLNQLKKDHDIKLTASGDFLVDDRHTFKMYSADRKQKPAKDEGNSYIIADDIEIGSDRRIPVWLLGFLY